jgi:hypothetical protein
LSTILSDADEDVRSGTVHKFLLDFVLQEAIIDQHRLDGPPTLNTAHTTSMAPLRPLRYSVFAVGTLGTDMVTGVSG